MVLHGINSLIQLNNVFLTLCFNDVIVGKNASVLVIVGRNCRRFRAEKGKLEIQKPKHRGITIPGDHNSIM